MIWFDKCKVKLTSVNITCNNAEGNYETLSSKASWNQVSLVQLIFFGFQDELELQPIKSTSYQIYMNYHVKSWLVEINS